MEFAGYNIELLDYDGTLFSIAKSEVTYKGKSILDIKKASLDVLRHKAETNEDKWSKSIILIVLNHRLYISQRMFKTDLPSYVDSNIRIGMDYGIHNYEEVVDELLTHLTIPKRNKCIYKDYLLGLKTRYSAVKYNIGTTRVNQIIKSCNNALAKYLKTNGDLDDDKLDLIKLEKTNYSKENFKV